MPIKSHNFLILILLFLTLLLRLPLLNGSFWLDEAAQILESSRPWQQQLQIQGDFQPPLLHLTTFLVHQFSVAVWWLRLWGAVIPSLITSWAVFQLMGLWWPTTKAGGIKKITWIGLLLASNSLWVFYSQELRPYSLAVMWSCLSWWLVVKLIRNHQNSSKKIWLTWIATVLGGLYSTYLFPFVLISQGLFLVWQTKYQPRLWRGLIIASLGIVLGFLPWVPAFMEQLQTGQQLRLDLPGWDQVVSTTQLKTLPLAAGKFVFGVVDLELTPQYLILAAILSIMMSCLLWHTWRTRHQLTLEMRQAILVLSWWIIVPVVLAWLVSFKIPIIQPKRVLFVLPAFYSLITILALELKSSDWFNKFKFGQLILISFLIINLWGLTQYWLQPNYQREDWRGLRTQLLAQYPLELTAAVFSFPEPFAGWRWYDKGQTKSYNLGFLSSPNSSIDVTNELKTAHEKFDYLLVFEYLEPITDPRREVKASLQSLGWKEIGAVSRPGVGFVRVYAKSQNLLGLSSL